MSVPRTEPQSIDLTCTVIRGNPMTYTYSWSLDGNVLPGENSFILSITSFSMGDVGTYRCDVRNSDGVEGVGMDSIAIGCELPVMYGTSSLTLGYFSALVSTVSVPAMLSVVDDGQTLQVCATLNIQIPSLTPIDISVELNTSDITGIQL